MPPDLCDLSPIYAYGDGPLTSPQIEESDLESVTQLDANGAAAAINEAGFTLDNAQQNDLSVYEREGWSFAWLEMGNSEVERVNFVDWYVQLTPFVIVRYPGTTPVLPMRFHARDAQTYEAGYEAAGVVSVQAFVIADEPYLPDNYAFLTPNLSNVQSGGHNLGLMPFRDTSPRVSPDQPYYDYYNQLRNAVSEQNGLAYSLEYVGTLREQSDSWRENNPDGATILDSLSLAEPVLTRIQTFLAPDQPVPDLTFAPASSLGIEVDPDFLLHTSDYYDPLKYWGCSSRTLIDEELEIRLPLGRTYIDALHLYVAHPDDWRLTVLNFSLEPEESIYIFAPVEVIYSDLVQAEQGNSAFPMLVIGRTIHETVAEIGYIGRADTAWDWFTQYPIAPRINPIFASTKVYLPRGQTIEELEENDPEPPMINVIQAGIYAPAEDLRANEALYLDLLRYLNTRQYMLSPELQHTLYLGNIGGSTVGIGYPSDWIETYEQGEIVVLPADLTSTPEMSPYARLIPMQEDRRMSLYGVSVEAAIRQRPVPFNALGRRGFLLYSGGVFGYPIIEFSAPIDSYDEYAPLLETMLAAVQRGSAGSPRG
jgi:hypothetical protein